MSFEKIIFCHSGKENKWYSFYMHFFSDLMHDERVIYLEDKYRMSSCPLINFFRKVHFSTKINQKINLPFKGLWQYSLEKVLWDDRYLYVVVFIDDPAPIPVKTLKKIRQAHHVKFSLLLLNSFTSKRQMVLKPYFNQLGFDYVFTFDQADAKRYGFIHTDSYYSILNVQVSKIKGKDIYYIGGNKGRLKDLLSIYSAILDRHVTSIYRIIGVKLNKQQWKDKIIYNDFIEYNTVVEELQLCNCILELIVSGQSGATARYYEAICYNKKLLTNNKNVINLPFYNPDYIHVFEKPEDIDWDWVKERIPVDYHYDGRFSPTHLIDRIFELEEEKSAECRKKFPCK